MINLRVEDHPVLKTKRENAEISFYWGKNQLKALKGEMISTSLFANGIKAFGHHHKDKKAQGIFCANGQCSQCTVIANGLSVKSCITEVKEGMIVEPCEGLPKILDSKTDAQSIKYKEIPTETTDVLIVGGGPAGLAAAIELSKLNIHSILVDDKQRLGGKLFLQTHTFFGSQEDCYAGARGIDIAAKLEADVLSRKEIKVMTETQAVAVYSDNKVGVVKNNDYTLIKAKAILIATGAREKALSFKGCDLPGVYGAGAFQTLVNRDLIKAGNKIFIVGGGNVGLIAGYHGLQAGMIITGLIEAMPKVSGYKVHKDKLQRLGIEINLQHTILSANANETNDGVKSVTIAKIDNNFKVISGTERTIECDTVLVAAGLSSCNEFYNEAKEFNMNVYMAGDAEEIAEASAAMFSGKLSALKIAKNLGVALIGDQSTDEYFTKMEILKSRPGKVITRERIIVDHSKMVFPVFHCTEEIPCNPCTSACPEKLIYLKGDNSNIMDLPFFDYENSKCIGCSKCAAICPGLAVSIADRRKAPQGKIFLQLPFELKPNFQVGEEVTTVDVDGNTVEKAKVVEIYDRKWQDKTLLVKLLVNEENFHRIIGIKHQDFPKGAFDIKTDLHLDPDSNIVCRCEKVTAGEIRQFLKLGLKDMNTLKFLRCTMGACGGKTCGPMIRRIFNEEGFNLNEVRDQILRPLNAEITLGAFAGVDEGNAERKPDYESYV